MGSNLIQNYINNRPVPVQKAPKSKPDFDIQRELDNRTFIKPLRSKGRLLRTNIFNTPKILFDDFVYNSKSFKHALEGEANDHELGKLNDVGLMLGGLGIASYLMLKRNTPMQKSLEFVGLGAFLASMSLWPKLAIQLPAYLIHGVNVQKEYKDSFGRKKLFYQDPQFIPWDLYSDEEIDKIGDRLGVSRDIPNRRFFIQERMRKLAIQNNTLWMLTAGFATPVMTGLICNGLEPYLGKYLNNKRNNEADKLISNVENASKKYQTNDISKGLKAIINEYDGKEVTPELIEKISELYTKELDFVTERNFKLDLANMIGEGEFSINRGTAENISAGIEEILKKAEVQDGDIKSVILSKEEMVKLFETNGFFKNVQNNRRIDNAQNAIVTGMYEKRKDKNIPEDVIKKIRDAIGDINKLVEEKIKNCKTRVFDSTLQTKLSNVAGILDNFIARNLVLDEYALLKTGAAPETIIANYWNDVSSTLLQEMGFTYKEIEKVKFDKKLMGKLFTEKLEAIVADKGKYEKVLSKLAEKISEIDSLIKPSDMASHLLKGDGAGNTAYEKAVDQVFDSYAQKLRTSDFKKTADALNGKNGNPQGSCKNIQKAFVEERLLGVKSSFYRLITTFDFFRRMATDPNNFHPYEGRQLCREEMEELIKMCESTLVEGHSSDYAIKFYMLRNRKPNKADCSKIELENGKPKFKYINNPNIPREDIPGDKHFYQDVMKFIYEDNMHADTKSILTKFRLDEEVTNYRNRILDILGGDDYFWKPRHLVRSKNRPSSDIKFLLTGISPEEFIFKRGQQFYNTKTWLKMFGTIGAGLLGLTVLAQFFLGKIKDPKKAGENDYKN